MIICRSGWREDGIGCVGHICTFTPAVANVYAGMIPSLLQAVGQPASHLFMIDTPDPGEPWENQSILSEYLTLIPLLSIPSGIG